MTCIGETLRQERQRRNLDLEAVSRVLKISPRFLEAIEEDRFDRLPGGVFAKSFVRQYARLLELDEEEAASQVQRVIATTAAPTFENLDSRTIATEFSPHVDAISYRPFASGKWLPALALVVAVMLGCSMVYGWWQRQHRAAPSTAQNANVPATPRSVVGTAQAAAPDSQGAAPDAGPAVPVPQPVDTAPAQPASAETPAANPPAGSPLNPEAKPVPSQAAADLKPLRTEGPIKVAITTSNEPVWVLARTDGKYAFSGTLEPNQTRTVDAGGIVLLRLGNAGGVTITVNGKPIPAVGPKGQVRTVQLTSGGFQIVAPPKPSATPELPL